MKRVSIGIVLLFWLVQFSNAATYYVDINGNDASGDGSSARPWRTLNFAVSRVAANQGHTIKISSGTFIEQGPIDVPTGVNIEGSGRSTVLKAASSFYYNPETPRYTTERYLIRFVSSAPTNGGQSIKNLAINGDGKRLHGGILFQNRDNILAEGLLLEYINFNGLWLWKSRNSRITNCEFLNCSWGSDSWCNGALNIGDLQNVEIDNVKIDEGVGYGLKTLGMSGTYSVLSNVKIHDCHVTVNPYGAWQGGQAPNIAVELWNNYSNGVEIYNNYIDNTLSLVCEFEDQTGKIRVHDNFFDMAGRSNGAGYSIELTIDNAEIDHNFFNAGGSGIANWGEDPRREWNIHHNVFYGLQESTSVALRNRAPVTNVKFNNNTLDLIGPSISHAIGLYTGVSRNFEIKNNLFINSGPSTNRLIFLANGATIQNLQVTNNHFRNLAVGNVAGSYTNNITGVDPQINATGNRPDPYYRPKAGSPLIDKGVNVGYPYSGSAPDIGAYEYGSTTTPPANTPPSVGLSSPSNNSSFSAGSSITISANAADANGSVSSVEFFNGTTKLGEDATGPYSFVWNNVPAGTYTITARATDNQGATTTSTPITITVVGATNTAPTVNITSPTNNSNFNAGSTITINANAADGDGTINKVEFFNGTTKLGEDTSSPYSFTWATVAAGTYTITARATDNQNAITNSSAITIVVNAVNSLPTVSLTAPANNSTFTAPASMSITATAADTGGTITKVEFFNGTTKLGEDTSSPYSFNWSSVAVGTYSITARATDNSGGVTNSAARTVTVLANALPSVAITSPSNNSSFPAGSTISLAATASDTNGTIAKVEFFNGTTKLGEDTTSPYSLTWTNVAAGTYTITARATDNLNGIQNSSPISITVVVNANSLPTVSLTSPTNNSSHITGANITLTATASDSDGTVSRVEFYSGSTKLGEDLTTPYSFVWNNISAGNYTLTARAVDNQNGIRNSTAVAISVGNANSLPSVNITSPVNNSTFSAGASITIAANASDTDGTIAKVEFYYGTTKLGEDATSPYSITWGNVPSGTYILTTIATDNSGGTATSANVTVTVGNVSNSMPIVALTSPNNTAAFSSGSVITLTANASDSDGTITKVEFFNGATKLGEDLVSPYSYSWNNVSSGSYILTARATDDKNGVSTSAPVSITVTDNNVLPTITITSPSNGSDHIAGAPLTITASATDSDGTISLVEFFNGTTKLGEDNSNPYAFTWSNPAAGSHTLVATATDNSGATATTQVTIFVNAQSNPPVANAGDDATVELPNSTHTLQGSGQDDDGVIMEYTWVQMDGPNEATLSVSSTTGEAMVSNLVEGTYRFILTVTDNANLESSDEIIITVVPFALNSVQFPLVFTPNNDGIDDTWNWSNTEVFEDCRLTIYNRFGQMIYETISYDNTWDGRVNGSPLQEDAYYYVITCDNGDRQGAVRIVR